MKQSSRRDVLSSGTNWQTERGCRKPCCRQFLLFCPSMKVRWRIIYEKREMVNTQSLPVWSRLYSQVSFQAKRHQSVTLKLNKDCNNVSCAIKEYKVCEYESTLSSVMKESVGNETGWPVTWWWFAEVMPAARSLHWIVFLIRWRNDDLFLFKNTEMKCMQTRWTESRQSIFSLRL